MTSHRDIARGCKRKARFAQRRDADARASAYGQAVYECRHCGGFHCTSGVSQGRVERERAERALAELHRKGVTGPLLETAIATVAEAWAKRDGR